MASMKAFVDYLRDTSPKERGLSEKEKWGKVQEICKTGPEWIEISSVLQSLPKDQKQQLKDTGKQIRDEIIFNNANLRGTTETGCENLKKHGKKIIKMKKENSRDL